MSEWKQERPEWCPYPDSCTFLRRTQDAFCGGELPEPVDHDGVDNTHRLCIHDETGTADYQVNPTDLDGLRWIFDALDGKKTSWLSRRGRR